MKPDIKLLINWSVGILIFLSAAVVLAQTPQTAEEFLKRGIAHQQNQRFAEALRDFNKAIELDPSYYWSYKQRAKAYRQTGKVKLAQSDEEKAAQIGAPK